MARGNSGSRAQQQDEPQEVVLVDGNGFEVRTSNATAVHNHLGAGFRPKEGTADEAIAAVTDTSGTEG